MKKKVLFGITSLTLGGAERVLVDIANQLCEEYEITIFTIYAKGELEKQLSPKVKLKSLYKVSFSELSKFQQHFSVPLKVLLFQNRIYQKKIKGNYDVEFAFLEGPITRIFSTRNEKTKKVVWVHNDISAVFGKGIKAKLKRRIDKKIYEKYQTIVFVSKDNREKFEEIYPLKNEKEVIYNYINTEKVIQKAKENTDIEFNKEEVNIVTVARLVKQKAIDRLIDIHSKLIQEGIRHRIYVIGDGPEKSRLEEKIKDKAVEKSFILLGQKENPYPYIKQADCFVLLSYYEGYPMVLLEAQILEKYIVITDTAARETLQNYQDCKIVGNKEEDIVKGLREVIQKKEKYLVKKSNTEEYQNKEIMEQIIKVIERTD